MAKPIYYYGTHAITAILTQRPHDALTLFVQQGRDDDSIEALLSLAKQAGVSVQYSQKDKLTQLCDSPQHQGVVLHARALDFADEAVLDAVVSSKSESLLLLLDQITDAHNLGACLRTAVAMGVDAVVCPKHHSASLTATVAKVSVGASELVPVVAVTNLARTLKQLKQAGVFVYGTALSDAAKPIHDCDFSGHVALIMGSEGEGIRRLTAELCDELVYIPMTGNAQGNLQSLNVSVATGMALYEVARQRLLK